MIEFMIEEVDGKTELVRYTLLFSQLDIFSEACFDSNSQKIREVVYRGSKAACERHLDYLYKTATTTTAPAIE